MSALSELGTLGRKKPPGQKKDNLAAYLFLTPWLLGLFLITVGQGLRTPPDLLDAIAAAGIVVDPTPSGWVLSDFVTE